VVSAKKVTVEVNNVDAVVEAPQFHLFLAISRRPVAKQSFLHFSGLSRCDWSFVFAGGESQDAQASGNAKA
jgi:hypothetical protein